MKGVLRWIALVLLASIAVQLYFVGRIALMAVLDPQSTAFQRSEVYRLPLETGTLKWRQQWVPYAELSNHLKRAVIASEDATFLEHEGVDLEALEKAWEKNAKAEQRAEKIAGKLTNRSALAETAKPAAKPAKIVGGSTITQQLAKNLFLSGERTLMRKGQELLLTLLLEALLSKQRILEIYLNNVEWGEGVFGAEAAAQHYYRKPAAKLSAYEAARLAVQSGLDRAYARAGSSYLASRSSTIAARMGGIELP